MTQKDWDKLLDKSPSDCDLRLAYATWLQDELDDIRAADFQRWMVSSHIFPWHNKHNWWLGARRACSRHIVEVAAMLAWFGDTPMYGDPNNPKQWLVALHAIFGAGANDIFHCLRAERELDTANAVHRAGIDEVFPLHGIGGETLRKLNAALRLFDLQWCDDDELPRWKPRKRYGLR